MLTGKFLEALPLLETLTAAGFEAYFVGGSVRDFLLNREIADVDIATSAFPDEVKQLFKHTIDTGIQHGTVTVMLAKEGYEITTFRTESTYQDFRRPDEVTFVRSLVEDLKRRDFTMNAIAMDQFGVMHDPYHGQAAIKAGHIEAVGIADERFSEDALRMMRALRFVSQLGFTLDEATKAAITANKALLSHIAVERCYIEMTKLLTGADVIKGLALIKETGLFTYLPGMTSSAATLAQLLNCSWSEQRTPLEAWTLLCAVVCPTEAKPFLKQWKASNETMTTVAKALRYYEEISSWSDLTLYDAGEATIKLVEHLKAAQQIATDTAAVFAQYEALPMHSRAELKVSGHDLMAWLDKKPGAWLANALRQIEEAVVQGELSNDTAAIKGWVLDENRYS
ncbi:CCA tRNA nucleotidyltransferase [Brochothrix campestris]|uniref:CCA-adding enzyme n=1 Tax=Brochothrix campestris FSL F6-1037 TaxID=1265861 RepID=W7CMX8_9LIST|nr:CCA tRNA nucleotidyltransferase [Brochothrix campestris]EUJ38030.1 tRNA CCA-pyrophosphorylase [Brochothrix campestris FSL F6-1037]